MMGRCIQDRAQRFYAFDLDAVVPDDHLVRKIAAVLDLSWVHDELAQHYSPVGRPSIDPLLIIRMLIIGYVFAIRSERALCREVQVNMVLRLEHRGQAAGSRIAEFEPRNWSNSSEHLPR